MTRLPRSIATAFLLSSLAGLSHTSALVAQQAPGSAQRVTDFSAARATKVYRTSLITAPPVIDGALDDAAWQTAPESGGFYQTEPQNGYPGTEDTRFKILYDEDNLLSLIHI